MVQSNSELTALLLLIDDPDDEIYVTVAGRLLNYGNEIIPRLEQLWEVTLDQTVQERLESLIHRVHFENLQKDFMEWCRSDRPDLLRGAILIAQYHFPDLNKQAILNQFEQIRRNVWLELNNYLTPLEQMHVFNNIIFAFYKFQGHEITEREPKFFFINHTFESKHGNPYTLGILMLSLFEALDIPIFAVNIPRQFLFAYIETEQSFFNDDKDSVAQIQFFIDPAYGVLYSQKDVDNYLHKINAKDYNTYFAPLLNRQIIYKLIEELCLCYRYRKEDHKADELQLLMRMINENNR